MTTSQAAPDDSWSRAFDRQLLVLAAVVAVIAALLILLPDLSPTSSQGLLSERVHARVLAVHQATGTTGPTDDVKVLAGSHAGQTFTAQVEGPSGQLELPNYAVGNDVVVALDKNPDGSLAPSVVDRWRLPVLGWLLGAFALATIAVAGWRGMRAILALALTLVLVVRVLIPLLLAGWNPVWLAVGVGVLVTAVSLLLTQGRDRTSSAAFTGITLGLCLTGVLAAIVTVTAQFTAAQGSEEVIYLQQLAGGRLDLSGLLLAAVIFGGLGVLMDVAVGQAATVAEIHDVDPALPRRQLYRRAMNVGTAHLAASVNTLVFAYLGAALPLLVLLGLQGQDAVTQVSSEVIAVEVVRTVVGAIGVLLAVPLTTAIAAWLTPATGDMAAGPHERELQAEAAPAIESAPSES